MFENAQITHLPPLGPNTPHETLELRIESCVTRNTNATIDGDGLSAHRRPEEGDRGYGVNLPNRTSSSCSVAWVE